MRKMFFSAVAIVFLYLLHFINLSRWMFLTG